MTDETIRYVLNSPLFIVFAPCFVIFMMVIVVLDGIRDENKLKEKYKSEYETLLKQSKDLNLTNLEKYQDKYLALLALIYINNLEKALLKLKYKCSRKYIYSVSFINVVIKNVYSSDRILPVILDLPTLSKMNLNKRDLAKYRRVLTTATKLN